MFSCPNDSAENSNKTVIFSKLIWNAESILNDISYCSYHDIIVAFYKYSTKSVTTESQTATKLKGEKENIKTKN